MKQTLQLLTEPILANSFLVERFTARVIDPIGATRLNYHRILLVENGNGRLTIDEQSFELKEQAVFLLSKGQIFQFQTPTTLSAYVISFGDCFWERTPKSASNCKAVLFNNAADNQYLQPTALEWNELLQLCQILLNEYGTAPYTNQLDVMAAYLKIIMIKLANVKIIAGSTFDSQDYKLYREFMELLSAQYHLYHAVSDYARLLNISARRLSELCKRCHHKSAKEIINGQLVAEAKRSLQFSSNTVKEIAYQLHFMSPEQFSHFFKRHTQLSPASYRSHFMGIET